MSTNTESSIDSPWLDPAAYAQLSERFHASQPVQPSAAPSLLYWNQPLARELRLPERASGDLRQLLAGDTPEGFPPSIATAYAGHQFGHFVPQLGDGRAVLLGDLRRPAGAAELQLKGSGRTPFSRGGDGRAALGPVLREVIVAEAMHALGVPTTRSLAALATGEQVLREAGPLPGAVLARVAASHVRVGSFEFFAARRDLDSLRALSDWTIKRHYPDCAGTEQPALALLEAVCTAQATLLAHWLAVGFVHGVMNTDNMCLSGETIDYGPCAFLDEYQSNKVFSSIDRQGRYAYGQQPAIAQWNLARLAECLLPLIDTDEESALTLARPLIDRFPEQFSRAWNARFADKLGLSSAAPGDQQLAEDFLRLLEQGEHDFSLGFRSLARRLAPAAWPDTLPDPTSDPAFAPWVARWQQRLAEESRPPDALATALRRKNPAVIPRNHQIEIAIAAAVGGDLQPFEKLLAACLAPFEDDPTQHPYMAPPAPAQRVLQTYCGT